MSGGRSSSDDVFGASRGLAFVASQPFGDRGQRRSVEQHGEDRHVGVVESGDHGLEVGARDGGDHGLVVRHAADRVEQRRRRRALVQEPVDLGRSRRDRRARDSRTRCRSGLGATGPGLDAAAQCQRVTAPGVVVEDEDIDAPSS